MLKDPQYLANKKQGQKQIFLLADMGKSPEHLAKSVFIEKLHARGYEVLLLNEPLDEIRKHGFCLVSIWNILRCLLVVQNTRVYKNFRFQDVAKAGLKFGDEGQTYGRVHVQSQLTRVPRCRP
jgi:heat shock protein beta